MDYKLERSNFWFPLAISAVDLAMNLYSELIIEMPQSTKQLISKVPKKDISIFYYSLHKSMMETLAIPYALHKNNAEVPYVIAAETLFKGAKAEIMKNVGVILINTTQQVREVNKINNTMLEISREHPILSFPEATRSRTGLPKMFANATFEALIRSAKERETYAILIDPTYSHLNEAQQYLNELERKKYGFSWRDIPNNWMHYQGQTYLSFSEPIKIMPEHNRKNISKICYEGCLNQIKILPINVYSETMQRINKAKLIASPQNIKQVMNEVLTELRPHHEKFRGFTKDYDADNIMHIVEPKKDSRENSIYANNIANYLNKK